ncbi:MAG: TVP38/TMEM64 family protein [Deltaproteobacteria bacterium]|nr:TVP38/TMEM64 family protein [Deltaproteobacteria bacterium]
MLGILAYLYIPYQNSDDIKSFIDSFGAAAPLAFIIICIVKPIIFFLPSLWLTIIAGTLFGPWYGTLYVAVGGAGSTVVGFYFTRWLGRIWIEQLLKGRKRLLMVDEKMEKRGFKTIFTMRLFGLPWDMVSYSAGLSSMRFKDFYFASLIALVPTSFIYTYFGSSILNPLSLGFIISLSVIIILGSLPYVFKRMKHEKP